MHDGGIKRLPDFNEDQITIVVRPARVHRLLSTCESRVAGAELPTQRGRRAPEGSSVPEKTATSRWWARGVWRFHPSTSFHQHQHRTSPQRTSGVIILMADLDVRVVTDDEAQPTRLSR